jgi:hypothetical protein
LTRVAVAKTSFRDTTRIPNDANSRPPHAETAHFNTEIAFVVTPGRRAATALRRRNAHPDPPDRAVADERHRVDAAGGVDVGEMIEADEPHHSALDVATWLLSPRASAAGNRLARPRRAQRAASRLDSLENVGTKHGRWG